MSNVVKAKEVKAGDYYLGRVTGGPFCGYDGIEVNDDDGIVEEVSGGASQPNSITLILDTGIEVELDKDENVAIEEGDND